AGNWSFSWSENMLRVTAEWREEFEAADYLVNNNTLVIEKTRFLVNGAASLRRFLLIYKRVVTPVTTL
ncbi:MAG: hypothetical protein LBD25_01180, partial [Coriobacteriales bacterium]|nr:hypothetical protein [Coriobacteriales bacterium]